VRQPTYRFITAPLKLPAYSPVSNLICVSIQRRSKGYKSPPKILKQKFVFMIETRKGRGVASGEFGYTGGSVKKNSFFDGAKQDMSLGSTLESDMVDHSWRKVTNSF
jgi:hypothetical protein